MILEMQKLHYAILILIKISIHINKSKNIHQKGKYKKNKQDLVILIKKQVKYIEKCIEIHQDFQIH